MVTLFLSLLFDESPTSTNLGNDHAFINKKYSLYWGLLGSPKQNQSGQYHTIVESRVHLTLYVLFLRKTAPPLSFVTFAKIFMLSLFGYVFIAPQVLKFIMMKVLFVSVLVSYFNSYLCQVLHLFCLELEWDLPPRTSEIFSYFLYIFFKMKFVWKNIWYIVFIFQYNFYS